MRKIFWIGLGWLFLTQLSRSLGSLGNFVASDESDMRLAVRDAG